MSAAEDLKQAASTLQSLLRKPSASADEVTKALSKGKRTLLTHNLLLPNPSAPPPAHAAARFILEASALLAIRAQKAEEFTRYQAALSPFYELPKSSFPSGERRGQRAKITGLFLMLLLTNGDYAGFHTLIEALEAEGEEDEDEESSDDSDDDDSSDDEDEEIIADPSIRYPIALERCLMEGSYDRVWELAKSERLPSEEFGVFSQVLIGTIRKEIASCSEKAYPSIPVTNAKNLLFLPSEGEVVKFAHEHSWELQDGRIYFPQHDAAAAAAANEDDQGGAGGAPEDEGGDESGADAGAGSASAAAAAALLYATNFSGQLIENTIGYARELETIV